MSTETKRSTTKPSKQLPEQAVRLMNAWFLANEDNPYPNRNDLDYLATNGGIKESQVKAWFSNKRNRTQNTHPKRAKRNSIRNQIQQNFDSINEPQKIHLTDKFEQQTMISCSNPQYPPMNWSWPLSNSPDYYYYQHHHHQY